MSGDYFVCPFSSDATRSVGVATRSVHHADLEGKSLHVLPVCLLRSFVKALAHQRGQERCFRIVGTHPSSRAVLLS